MHSHDFCEVLIYAGGDIQYINENSLITPHIGDVIISRPGRMHAALLQNASVYERYVLQFTPDVLRAFGSNTLLSFTEVPSDRCLIPPPDEVRSEIFYLLGEMEKALKEDSENSVPLTLSFAVRLFDLLCRCAGEVRETGEKMPDNIRKIKEYIDSNFSEISSTEEVAEHFYYSREYVSRLFKRYFNTTISDYIVKRKINASKQILTAGGSVTDACYSSGFKNMSSYIKRFSSITGVTPSHYRKSVLDQ